MFREALKKNKILGTPVVFLYRVIKRICKIPKDIRLYIAVKKKFGSHSNTNRIIYIGVPVHNNLGDLAQGVCIRKWIRKHFPDYEVLEIETNALVNTTCSALKLLKTGYREQDIIIFQSGYTTTDLGGYADEMHCAVIRALPDAKILMMPQTVFFKSEKRKKNTAQTYDSAKNMLFLARDNISYNMAKEMFKTIPVEVYPDIVTTLIGQYTYTNKREGIIFCCRDDSEKYYSDTEISNLMAKCSCFATVEKTDTTKKMSQHQIKENTEQYIMSEINKYSRYKVMITDRYHGTIFSLIAGTPVIIIKTTDHKVTTGAEWFRGIYNQHVFVADSLEEAYKLAKEIYQNPPKYQLNKYFEEEFYDKLPAMFSESIECTIKR